MIANKNIPRICPVLPLRLHLSTYLLLSDLSSHSRNYLKWLSQSAKVTLRFPFISIENQDMPDWARNEREQYLAWIEENRGIFWLSATVSFEALVLGAFHCFHAIGHIRRRNHASN